MSGVEDLLLQALRKALQQALLVALRPPQGAGTVERPVRPRFRLRQIRTPRTTLDDQDVAKMADSLARRLEPLRRYEFANLPDEEWDAAVAAVCDSFSASGPIDIQLMFRMGMTPARLLDHVIASSGAVRAASRLGSRALPIYERLLDLTCRHLIEYVTSLPQFSKLAHVHELAQLKEIEALLPGHDGVSAARVALFERKYLDEVVRKLDRVELFGVSLSRKARRYTMSTAYISLALGARTSAGTAYDGSHGRGLRVEHALADGHRVLLRGLAGSGKTTLLQWFALRAARNDFGAGMAAWQGTMPFFLPLRQYVASRELPVPERFPAAVAPLLADEAPEGWVRQRLSSGRALVLVDGVDEVPEPMRRQTEEWLHELVGLFPDARYVVTSRPSAIDDEWLTGAGFACYEVLPMSRADVREFIMRWHAAARENCDDELEMLDLCEQALSSAVAAQPHLSRLATSPLLCALLCALNRDRRSHLPRDRHELFDAALDMLLSRRDQERELGAPEGVALSTTQATALLQRIAYWMLRNGLSAVSIEDLAEQVGRVLTSMPHVNVPAEMVVRHLVGRTGLLREAVPGSIDFVHRTFQDYLAARAAVDENDLGLLVRMAHDDRWHDVVIMAVPHARTAERSRLLDSLLNRGDDEVADRKRLHLLAAAGLELATEVDLSVSEGIHQRTAELVPPRSLGEADELALAGDFVLGLLPGPNDVDERTAAACVRTAATIGGAVALSFLTTFAGEDRPEVLRELAAAWRRFEVDDYADAMLRHVTPLDRVWLTVEGPAMLRALRHLDAVRWLWCSKIDTVEPLTGLTGLRKLVLDDCPGIDDLAALAGHPIEHLGFQGAAASALDGLSRLTSLTSIALNGFHRAVETLEQILPADLRITWLGMRNADFQPRLAGIERWPTLRSVQLAGWPERRDIERLAALPELTALSVSAENTAPDLAPLTTLAGLDRLVVAGAFISYADLRPLATLPRLRQLALVGSVATQGVPVNVDALLAANERLTIEVVNFHLDPSTSADPDRLTVVLSDGVAPPAGE